MESRGSKNSVDPKNKKNNEYLTVPNILSLIRLLLIPVMMWLYFAERTHIAAFAVFVVSALTDIADGYIARKFDAVTDLGKVLDPAADKLTQLAVMACLAVDSIAMRILFVVHFVKELTLTFVAYLALRVSKNVNSAKWYGKLSTVIIFAVATVHFLYTDIPENLSYILVALSIAMMIASLVLYTMFYYGVIKEHKAKAGNTEEKGK